MDSALVEGIKTKSRRLVPFFWLSKKETFWDKLERSLSEEVLFSRKDLYTVFPHRGIALVVSYAQVVGGQSKIVLLPSNFKPYLKGHNWFLPAHWLSEFAAQAAGLQGLLRFFEMKGQPTSKLIPSFAKTGDWLDSPLTADISKNCEPLIAEVDLQTLKVHDMYGLIVVKADVLIQQGSNSAAYGNMRLTFKRAN